MQIFRLPIVLCILLLVCVLVNYHGISDVSAAATLPSGFQEQVYVDGLTTPTAMSFSPDGRLFISEKDGSLRIVKNGLLLPDPFMTLSVDTFIERGLLGVVFDPDFATNRYLYVYYTTPAPSIHNRLSRFTASESNGDMVQEGSEVILIDSIPSDSGMHNGGALHFGTDGKLYISVGDGGSTSTKAQDLTNLSGKILRINKDGSIPADNPYITQPGARGEIWAYGLRNPFTFAIHPGNGTMYINDVGANVWEEVNHGAKGGNYGWPTCEGTCSNPSFLHPIYADYHPRMASITGAAFYTGSQFPADYASDYFFGDYVKNFIRRMDASTLEVSDFATNVPSPVDIRIGPDGSVYYLSIGSGAVYKISYGVTTPTPSPTSGPTVSPTPVSGQGLKASYFPGEMLSGTPVMRTDQTVNFNWGLGSPVSGIHADSFSVIWEGQVLSQDAGTYTFFTNSDDGVRLWVDNTLVIDKWISQSATEHSGTVTFQANKKYNIRLEYFEGVYTAGVQLFWSGPGITKQIVPTTALFTSYDDSKPTVQIQAPSAAKKYKAGETIAYAGLASDIEDKQLPNAAYEWQVVFHHDTHTHPFLDNLPNAKSGSFTIPQTGETATNVWYRIYLRVTDTEGNETEVYRDIHPEIVDLTIQSNPTGASLTVDGQPRTAPYIFQSVVGMQRNIGAPESFVKDGQVQQFDAWSNGEDRVQTVITPNTDQAYTAVYTNEESETNGLLGTYFDDMNLTGKSKQRIDTTINFVWNQDAPIADIYKETFSVRWTGFITPPVSGEYTFYAFSDDGIRLWIDDKPVIDNWNDQSRKETSGKIMLTGGERVKIRMEFYDRNIDAVAQLYWSGPSLAKQLVPTTVLETGIPESGDGLRGDYFDNKDFTGIKQSRLDPLINFNWGRNAPISGISPETFAVRWTGYIKPEFSEHYTFYAKTDDGVRVYINNILIIDNLTDQQAVEKQGNIALQKDIYYPIRIEYYDNTIDAVAQLSWSSPSESKKILPTKHLFSQ